MSSAKKWFLFMTVFAFASVISFFQINSYWADKHNFNGLFGWLGIGIITGIIAVYGLYKVNKHSNTSEKDSTGYRRR